MGHRRLRVYLLLPLAACGAAATGEAPSPSDGEGNSNIPTSEHCSQMEGRYFPGTHGHLMALNAYYLQEETARDVRQGTEAEYLDEVLAKTSAMGLSLIRTWAFNDGANKVGDSAMQVAPLQYDETSLRGLDLVLERAHAAGVRLILTLGNYWDDYGGARRYVQWAGHDDATQGDARFFTEPNIVEHYKDHIAFLLQRTNTYDGIAYAEHPAVLAWEILNEPRAPAGLAPVALRLWVDEIAAHVKTLSTKPVGTGEEGFDAPGVAYDAAFWDQAGPAWLFAGGQSFALNTASPYIDFGSVHLYPESWQFTPALSAEAGARWIEEHARAAHDLGKPVIVGELGLRNSGAFTLSERRAIYREWLACAFVAGAAATVPWLFSYDARPDEWDRHTFYFKDGSAPEDEVNRYADLFIEAAAYRR